MKTYNYAKLIRHVRKSIGLTQEQFARELGVSRSTVANYETKKIKPSADVLVKVQMLANEIKAA